MPSTRILNIVKELKKSLNQSERTDELLSEIESLWREQHSLASDRAELFKAVVDNVIDGIITINPKGFIQTFNQAAEKIFGYKESEIIGQNMKLLMPDSYVNEYDNFLLNYVNDTGTKVEGLKKNGSFFPIDLSISQINLGHEIIFAAILRDITEEQYQKEELKQSQERLQSILDNVYEGIITINSKGIIDSFNLAAEEIFGYKQNEVIGKNVKMLMPEPYHSEHDGYLNNFISTGKAKIIGIGREVRGRRKDSSIFPLFLAVTNIQNHGKPLFVGMVRDLSEQKRLEQLKNEFVSTVSHELRTPLTSIRGSLSLIESGVMGKVNEKVEPLIEIALNNSNRLILLINDILDIEKIESGKMDFNLEIIDLNKIIESCVKANDSFAKEHSVSLNFEKTVSNISVYVDSNRLQQVLTNLISNAVKYSPKNECVTIQLLIKNRKVIVEVKDKGPGIPDSFKKQIFQKFAQADSSDTKQKGGTGLGLSISKAILEKFGGTIGFLSLKDQGTTFFFDLPIITNIECNNNFSFESKGKILLIEDNYDVATLLGMILQKEEISYDIAYTANEAKIFLKKNKYDAMTLDINLPDQDGISFLEEVRLMENLKDLPVIVISAREENKEINSFSLKIVEWINKPIEEKHLINSLYQVINNNEKKRSKILHIEDDFDIANFVNILLKDLCDITLVTSKKEAIKKLQKRDIDYDLILLDMMLPDGSAEDIIPHLKENYINIPIVLFSAQEVNNQLKEQVKKALVKSRTSNLLLIETIKEILNKKDERL